MRQSSVINFILSGLIGLTLISCGNASDTTPDYRYRLTVELDTPDGLKTGSSVIEVTTNVAGKFSIPSPGRVSHKIRGEAVEVDLGSGRKLFALLLSDNDVDWASRVMFMLAPSAPNSAKSSFQSRFDNMIALEGAIPLPRMWPPKAHLRERSAYPMLVTFGDIADPTSVMVVDPDELNVTFGDDVSLKRITVEITSDPVTKKIEKTLSTDFFERWSEFRDRIQHCQRFDHPYFRQLATQLAKENFLIDEKVTDNIYNMSEHNQRREVMSQFREVPCEYLIPEYTGGKLRDLYQKPDFKHQNDSRESGGASPELARWTPGDKRPTSDYLGRLSLFENCLAFESSYSPKLIVFPYGYGFWDAERKKLILNDQEYAIGDNINLYGGSIKLFIDGGNAEIQSDTIPLGRHDFGSCNGYDIFLVDERKRK